MTDENDFIAQYKKLVASIVYPYLKYDLPAEDLNQEGMVGLLEAKRRYSEEKGASFPTYATYWIKKKILAYVDKEFKQVYKVEDGENSVAVNSALQSHQNFDKKNDVSTYDDTQKSLHLPADMPQIEQTILNLYFTDKQTLSQIAQALGISREKTRQLKNKALRRLRVCFTHPAPSM